MQVPPHLSHSSNLVDMEDIRSALCFFSIQGLAEEGLISSKFSRRDKKTSSYPDQSTLFFTPESFGKANVLPEVCELKHREGIYEEFDASILNSNPTDHGEGSFRANEEECPCHDPGENVRNCLTPVLHSEKKCKGRRTRYGSQGTTAAVPAIILYLVTAGLRPLPLSRYSEIPMLQRSPEIVATQNSPVSHLKNFTALSIPSLANSSVLGP
ncbi:hypothetical protein HAX54_039325 [Datura stramonium]|uniref:Uncharacterized protein n=1 Tax=Datura stramonium TaxID=4076 RepID=A0ABS8SIZ3_DATST|nr:hypothetical protein [Datura stramonium]